MAEKENRRSTVFTFAMFMAILCLISGVLLCGELLDYAIESNTPVTSIDIADSGNEVSVDGEDDEDIHALVKTRIRANPSIQFSDADKIWLAGDNEVNIFKVSYDNELGDITVDGVGNKVIAPGTTNTYYFELENTGNVGIDYQVTMNAYISDNITTIPVDAKLSDYNGRYIIGSETSWENVLEVNPDRVNDTGELSVGNKMRYIFSWQWPYESGNDEFDTMLGNLAVDEEVTLTVEINAVAMADEYAEGGFQTGDDTDVAGIAIAAVASFSMFIFLLALRRKEEEDEEA